MGQQIAQAFYHLHSIALWIFVSIRADSLNLATTTHSNDSHQCPILAADIVIFYYGTENEEAIQAGAGSE